MFGEKFEVPVLAAGLLVSRVCGNLGKCILIAYSLTVLSRKLPNTASEVSNSSSCRTGISMYLASLFVLATYLQSYNLTYYNL